MKNLIVTLAVFLLTLFIGCQENMITDPDTSLLKKDNLVAARIIKLCCELRDPGFGMCNLSGRVTYVYQIINRAQNPMGLIEISLHLEMDSKLIDKLGMTHLEWRIQGRSDEIVTVSEEGILLIEKTYPITNRNDVVLLVRYMVTTSGVDVSQMILTELER